MIKRLYRVYNYIAGIVLLVLILDRYMAKILKIIDPAFREMLESKLIKADEATAKEEILHILKSNGSIKTEVN